MASKYKILLLLLIVSLLLSGCGLLTLEELYCLPKRSESYSNLQSQIDDAMEELTYSAPLSGDNRQSIQTADLDGDGAEEYLLFAKDDSENPLKILIFSQVASGYVLMDTIEGYGFAFDFVEYVQMDDREGLEIVVGRQVSDKLDGAVSVYRFTSGFARQLLSVGHASLVCEDLDQDGMEELLLLTAGVSERSNGVAVLYDYQNDEMQRSAVSDMSVPIQSFRQIQTSLLDDGSPAVYVTSVGDAGSLVVDMFAVEDEELKNLSGAIRIPSVHNYNLFPADMDEDGIIEIPKPVAVPAGDGQQEYILQWYSVGKDGSKQTKLHTFHHQAQGWYLILDEDAVESSGVQQNMERTDFLWLDPASGEAQVMVSIYTLTGSDREEQAQQEGRILLYKSDIVIYVAEISELGQETITEEDLLERFRLIRKEWNTEESGE